MATKSQKRAQKARRKAKKKRREKSQLRQTSSAKRLALRLSKQVPTAWEGELPEDVAVFDSAVRKTLSSEAQQHAELVETALNAVCKRGGIEATESLRQIPRRSLFSEWRIFLRGLVDWVDRDTASAEKSWERLDAKRRPSRIALALKLAHRDDLSDTSADKLTEESSDQEPKIDSDVLYHAKLVRKYQVERSAIKAASEIERIPKLADDETVNPGHITWLRNFTAEYRLHEPELVQTLHEVMIRRAMAGPYIDMILDAAKYFRGPKHDRRNTLCRYVTELASRNPIQVDTYFNKYVNLDLPKNDELAPKLREALQSQMHVRAAALELERTASIFDGMMTMFGSGPDVNRVMEHFQNAISIYPTNETGHKGLEAIYADKLSNDRLLKAERNELLGKLADVHRTWVDAIPDAIEPRLALVDYLLENDLSDEAKKHIDWLAGTRREAPLADATSWKFSLLETMRLCRRKSWVPQAVQQLDQAEKLWPKWLGKEWIPFLRAAVSLRAGEHAEKDALMQQTDENASTSFSITNACMMLSAAQRMRVPAADLKPLRQPIEAALKKLKSLSVDDLISAASFYWDLKRTNLTYPAYKKHGNKFLTELIRRINGKPALVKNNLDTPLVQGALLIAAHEGLFSGDVDVKLPIWLERFGNQNVVVASVRATAALRCKYPWEISKSFGAIGPLRKAETSDRFYRHFYGKLADQLEVNIQQDRSPRFGPFSGSIGIEEEDDDYCDCDACRAARGEI